MLRVVLDANVIVSALIRPEGPPGRILEEFSRGTAFENIVSALILAELKRCLSYKKIQKYIYLSRQVLNLWLISFEVLSVLADGDGPKEPRLRDLNDAIYLNAAFCGRASFIVTGDIHLLELEQYEGISIVKPIDFIRILGKKSK